jgi:hypothetical protein
VIKSKSSFWFLTIVYLVEEFLGSTSAPTNVRQTSNSNTLDDLNFSSQSTVNYTRQYDCLNRITGQGLQIQYRFPRSAFQRATNMVHVELVFTNTTTNKDIQSIRFIKSVCFIDRLF